MKLFCRSAKRRAKRRLRWSESSAIKESMYKWFVKMSPQSNFSKGPKNVWDSFAIKSCCLQKMHRLSVWSWLLQQIRVRLIDVQFVNLNTTESSINASSQSTFFRRNCSFRLKINLWWFSILSLNDFFVNMTVLQFVQCVNCQPLNWGFNTCTYVTYIVHLKVEALLIIAC